MFFVFVSPFSVPLDRLFFLFIDTPDRRESIATVCSSALDLLLYSLLNSFTLDCFTHCHHCRFRHLILSIRFTLLQIDSSPVLFLLCIVQNEKS